jgi:putrescine transport system permease protein
VKRLLKRLGLQGRTLVTAVPYLWLVVFFLIPFAIVLKISFSSTQIAMPPYEPLVSGQATGAADQAQPQANFLFLLEDNLYWKAYLNSILKSPPIATVICLLIGYPIAYAIARSPGDAQYILLMLVVLPFWTSFLLRVYAWIGILKNNGLINNLLWRRRHRRADEDAAHDFAVYVGIVYSYLPFMILPLYANLEKMDLTLLEAAATSAASPGRRSCKMTLPLSKFRASSPARLLVIIPAVGEFVIPELLGRCRHADDRQGAVDRVLQQPRLAGRRPSPSRCCCSSSRSCSSSALPAGRAGRAADMSAAKASCLPRSCCARLRVPLHADPLADRVLVQRVAAGHGLGRVLDQMVRRAVRDEQILDAAKAQSQDRVLTAAARGARHAGGRWC